MREFSRHIAYAISGSLVASLAFPQPGIEVLMLIGLPLMIFAFRGLKFWQSATIGLLVGFVYYGTVARWVTIYLGIVPWLGLVGAQALIFSAFGVVITAAWRLSDRLDDGVKNRLIAASLVAAAWACRETFAANWPYGGFGWARVITGFAESPLRFLATLFGITGAGFVVSVFSVFVVLTWQSVSNKRTLALQIVTAILVLLAPLPGAYLLLQTNGNESIRVEAVQGNSDSALFSTAQRGDAILRHNAAMNEAGLQKVDLVIWPENAMDINPLENPQAAELADRIAVNSGGRFLFGTITADGSQTFNSALLWEAGSGVVDQYDKVHPVPFAEYLPSREFFYPLAPDLFKMVPRDYTLGTRDPVMQVGQAVMGIAICYDIVDDGLFREMLSNKANFIVAPTNNSDFGRTDEGIQQLGIARIRAVETGRSVANVSTVGVSAIIAPDGSDLARLEPFTAGVMTIDVPLSEVVTPASVIGFPLEISLCMIGISPALFLLMRRIRKR